MGAINRCNYNQNNSQLNAFAGEAGRLWSGEVGEVGEAATGCGPVR